MWNLDAPPGFQGLDPHKDVTVYMGRLPHWRQEGATYFVTYRLADSLPDSRLRQLAAFRREWEWRHPPPHSDEDRTELARGVMQRMEVWLDQGLGSCVLREGALAAKVVEAMRHFDADRYELDAYAVMPNHVHLLVRPFDRGAYHRRGDFQSPPPTNDTLERILQSWKRYTSRQINLALGRAGRLWQKESFDRIVRDEEHLYRCLQYIGANPSRAGLPSSQWVRWVRPEWEELGWRFANS
jgi:REP element-mobilizing transposase RayT